MTMTSGADQAGQDSPEQTPRTHRWWTAAWLYELALVAALYVGYSLSRMLADNDEGPARVMAARLLDLEKTLFFDVELAVNEFFVEHDVIGVLSSLWYASTHYIVTAVVLVWLYVRRRRAYRPLLGTLIVASGTALAFYLLMPTMPPRLFGEGYVDVLALHANVGWWGADASAPEGFGDMTNQLAAFPSMHAGWALWVALVAHELGAAKWVRGVAFGYAVTTAVVVVGTGNHWIVDVVVGWFVVLAAHQVVGRCFPRGNGPEAALAGTVVAVDEDPPRPDR